MVACSRKCFSCRSKVCFVLSARPCHAGLSAALLFKRVAIVAQQSANMCYTMALKCQRCNRGPFSRTIKLTRQVHNRGDATKEEIRERQKQSNESKVYPNCKMSVALAISLGLQFCRQLIIAAMPAAALLFKLVCLLCAAALPYSIRDGADMSALSRRAFHQS